jgi:streptogramin lyase
LAGASAGGEPLQPGDILVTDFSANTLFVIDRVTGAPTANSPGGMLDSPVGVAIRDDGFAFVSNVGSQLIVRVDPGVTPPTQVLISALVNPRGLAVDASRDLFVSAPSTDQILRIDSVTGVGTPVASGGILLFPSGLVRRASGDLVVADASTTATKILRVDPGNGTQTPLAMGGLLMVPRDVEVDPAGGLLVIDSGARMVIRVDDALPFDPVLTNPQPNQSNWAACPQFVSPRGIAVEASGSVLVSDFSAKQVFRIDPISRVCTPLLNPSPLVGPWDVAVTPTLIAFDPSDLLVAGGTADQVYRVDADPGDGTSVPLWPGLAFEDPVAVIRTLNGDYFVLEKSTIQRVTPGGTKTLVATITSNPATELPVDLAGIAVDANGELLVTDEANDRLLRVFPETGQWVVIADDDADPSAALGRPAGIALDRNGTALVANRGDSADTPAVPPGLVRVNPLSGAVSVVTNDAQFDEIVAVALDTNGDYLFSDRKPSPEGDTVWRLRASTPGAVLLYPVSVGNDLSEPRGLAIDLNRSVVVGNQGPKEILRLDPTSGTQTEVAPVPVFPDIRGIALDQIPSPAALDSDGDGILEDVDNCPETFNPDQLDSDGDGDGDVCDGDDDGDGVADTSDNCRLLASPDQTDSNLDGFGNRCDADYASPGNPGGDLFVGGGDFTRFRDAFQTSVGQPGYSAEIDGNSDGSIGAEDFTIFRSLFQRPPGPSGLVCAGAIPCLPPPPTP